MPGDRREQVFVSSTYLDLREERQAVIQALLIAGCIPAGMELFPAGNDEKWRLIQRVIDECDYYVLVVGGKYGSINPATDLSYTQMEFEYAESINKPIMAFLHGKPGQLTGDQIELEKEPREKLNAFRAKVEATRVVKYWTTSAELPGHVAMSLIETRNNYPAEGWIRANNAMTPEVRTELAELRARVAELTQEAGASDTTAPAGTDDLAQGEDEYQVEIRFSGYDAEDLDQEDDPVPGATKYSWTVPISMTWNDVLQGVGPTLLHEASEPELNKALVTFVKEYWRTNSSRLKPQTLGRQVGDTFASGDKLVADVVVQFLALGIIRRGVKKRTVSDRGKYWALTPYGEDQMMKLRAIKRS
jgi:hypothetical protein